MTHDIVAFVSGHLGLTDADHVEVVTLVDSDEELVDVREHSRHALRRRW